MPTEKLVLSIKKTSFTCGGWNSVGQSFLSQEFSPKDPVSRRVIDKPPKKVGLLLMVKMMVRRFSEAKSYKEF